MAQMGSFSASGMNELQRKMEKLQKAELDAFCDSCVKALAAELLRLVMQKTPVGDYAVEKQYTAKKDSKHHKKGDVYTKRVTPSGKQGGTLRRGWIAETHEEAAKGKGSPKKEQIEQYAEALHVRREGDMLIVDIANPVEYAAYVEYGHRKVNQGWVPGKLMLTKSEVELDQAAPGALKKKLTRFLRGHLA